MSTFFFCQLKGNEPSMYYFCLYDSFIHDCIYINETTHLALKIIAMKYVSLSFFDILRNVILSTHHQLGVIFLDKSSQLGYYQRK